MRYDQAAFVSAFSSIEGWLRGWGFEPTIPQARDYEPGMRWSPVNWLRGWDLNPRPSGYEPDELPGCSTPRFVRRGK
jgi:hypothetical protein